MSSIKSVLISPSRGPIASRPSAQTSFDDGDDVESSSSSHLHASQEHEKKHLQIRMSYFRSWTWFKSALTIVIIYLIGLSIVIFVFKTLPPLGDLVAKVTAAGDTDAANTLKMEIPHSIDELRAVRSTLESYKKEYGGHLVIMMVTAYIFLQTFMIPGPLGINILSGSLFPFWTAMLFITVVSTIGASLNFWLIKTLLKDAITSLLPSRIAAFQAEVRRHNAHLLNYMLFVRVTPVLPHWAVNILSPVVGVPYSTFALATAVGHQPMNFITVQAGAALSSINSISDLYSPRNIVFLMAFGVLALVPPLLKHRLRQGAQGLPRRQTFLNMLPIINEEAIAMSESARSNGK